MPPPISAADVVQLLEASEDAASAILVGGQALNIWALRYGLRPEAVLVSEDVDFVGPATIAARAAIQWGGRLQIAGMDRATPNVAVVTLDVAGESRTIDFLDGLLGVETSELQRFAVHLPLDPDGRRELRVMHPLHCLQSHISNAYGPPLNRRADPDIGERAADRARVAVEVLGKNIEEYLEAGRINDARKIVARLAAFARRAPPCEAWVRDGIDVLDAVPVDHPGWRRDFAETVFEPIRRRLARRRERYRAR